ncbi:hypothetical protein KL86APRO_10911 [uncultured Alphaproteobacteria bacterium]|uniref:Uncharacterized protein n=1 Tax=uncultured Alphaproteobacteria bacterium TaxID=91750 RepID=A0A212JE05_9PROT|nr:hypothetical protein KL86APRO_10911 [uncultured Alphaproteobacteria bacterium]
MDFPAAPPAAINPLWYAVFCDPEPLPANAPLRNRALSRVLRALLRPGFRHVYAMRRLHCGAGWLLFNPHSACIDVLEFAGDAFARQVFAEAGAGRCRVVAVATRRPAAWVPRLSATCVSAVAHLLGVPSRPWTTPRALYRQLQQQEVSMGSVFSPPKPDTKAADAAARQAKEEAAALEARNQARLRTLKAGQSGRSLLAYDGTGEAGVKTTLGAG